MRRLVFGAVLGMSVAPWQHASAQQAPATETPPAPAIAPAVTIASPLMPMVLTEISDATRRVDATDRGTLSAFYSTPGRELLWVTPAGLSARGLAAITEIRNAADWGLNPQAFDIPDPQAVTTTPDALAAAEVRLSLAVLKYARHARGGRIDVGALGRNIDQKPPLLEPGEVLGGIAAAPDPAAYLTGLHPKHPQFEKLRQALLAARKPATVTEAPKAPGADVKLPTGPRIKPGQSHAQVALLRQRLNAPATETDSRVLDPSLAGALREFQQSKGIEPDGVLNNVTRAALNGVAKPASSADNTQRILVNMERWRWLPADLGSFHVWDNVPEYRMRVMKDGRPIHSETIIVGKPQTPTPIFSADMKFVIFHPNWGVPDGIKMNELAPSLRASSGNSFFNWGGSEAPAVLRRHNLTVSYNGRPVDPSTVDWSTADIRQFQFTQPPSASNVLGVVKFRFPNKHDVYMHDTPERSLFSRADKAFSHGCMRVQNPHKLAEVLLGEDKGWTSAQVAQAIRSGGTQEVTLSKQIPVHVTYFTAVVDDENHLRTFGDIYGHDSRIASALEGKPIKLIAQTDPSVAAEREVKPRRTAQARVKATKGSSGGSNILSDIFSGLNGN